MRIDVLTLFPEMFQGPTNESLLKKAQQKGLLSLEVVNLRDFTSDKHKTADDTPYGGGPGMVMKVDVVARALSSIVNRPSSVILLCPTGKQLTQQKVNELAKQEHLVLLCGHYEGVDERVREMVDEEISIGDYVLTGGEIPAMVLIDAVARHIPGVVKESESVKQDSYYDGLLDFPSYTRPEEFSGKKVPDVLLSGNHAEIAKWRREQALIKTRQRRPDLLAKANVYLALLHYPVYNKRQDIVSTCITGFDLHDIARCACTFGIKKYYVVNPLPAQREFAELIRSFWMDDSSLEFNWTRAEAFKLISIKESLDETIDAIIRAEGQKPTVVGTSAKAVGKTKFKDLKREMSGAKQPYLLVIGTGWGIADEVFERFDLILEPIIGKDEYNHLSVRSANAIILDRLLGR